MNKAALCKAYQTTPEDIIRYQPMQYPPCSVCKNSYTTHLNEENPPHDSETFIKRNTTGRPPFGTFGDPSKYKWIGFTRNPITPKQK